MYVPMTLLVGLAVLAAMGLVQAALTLWAGTKSEDDKPHWTTPTGKPQEMAPEGFVWVLMRREDAKDGNEI